MNVTNTFQWFDYAVFSVMFGSSALIGLYFGFCGKKQDSPEEYLHGGKKMKILPVAASLIASDVSGILFLGAPSDVYLYGSAYAWTILGSLIGNFGIIYIYLPVFYNLQMTSCFEYLKKRFSSRLRGLASVIYTVNQCLYMPIVMYTSVLAFGQVSKVNLNLLTIIVCIICILYTMYGGIKTVVWTDTLQVFVMIGSLLIVFCLGIISDEKGGLRNIWDTSLEGGRIDTNLDYDPTNRKAAVSIFIGKAIFHLSLGCNPMYVQRFLALPSAGNSKILNTDPTDRTAAYTVTIGALIYHLNYGSNPMYVQRFLALPSLRNSKISVHLLMVGIFFFRLFTTFLGLIIYTRYANCDPLSAGYIQKLDQLVPYYIMDVGSILPGLPGLFIAGIFCAALSTMSSFLNTLAGTIYEDFIKDRMPSNTTKKRATDIMKIIVAILGIVSMLLVFIVQHLGGILELTMVLRGAVTGPVLAMFTLGMLVPFINEKGIFYGSIGGTLIMTWILIGAKYYAITGEIVTTILPLSIADCDTFSNNTIFNQTLVDVPNNNDPFYLYRISFYYYCIIGVVATTIIAIPISLITKHTNQSINRNLFSPIIYKFLLKDNETPNKEPDKELEQLNKQFVDTK